MRSPLLALGLAALAIGVWAGLLRFGWSLPGGHANLIELHGPLMVFGFLGTVISLERAVALRLGRTSFAALTLVLLAGLVLSAVDAGAGIRLAGAVLAGNALWLGRFDIARRTLRRPGLPRFVALALLPGYVWLGVGGILWRRHGAVLAGPAHDAELHAIFLGIVFSMIFGHAPVIFPGVLGIASPSTAASTRTSRSSTRGSYCASRATSAATSTSRSSAGF